MAWTRSAPQRGSVASVVIGAGAEIRRSLHLHAGFRWLGLGDAPRGACVAIAATFVASGVALPTLDAHLTTALLFIAAALAALAALTREPSPVTQSFVTVAGAERVHHDVTPVALGRIARSPLDRSRWQQLTHHMSHELRTPLNAVLGFSELMSHEVCGPMGSQCYSDYAQSINFSGHQLLKSAEDALAITALLMAPEQRASPSAVCCLDAVDQTVVFLSRAMAPQGTQFCTQNLTALAVQADAQTLRQLLINVACAVGEHAKPGSTLSFTNSHAAEWMDLTVTCSGHSDGVSTAPAQSQASSLVALTLADLAGVHICFLPQTLGQRSAVIRLHIAEQHDLFDC